MNSIRALYLDHLELFRPIVADRVALAESYRAAAAATRAGDAEDAADRVRALAAAQEARLLEALA